MRGGVHGATRRHPPGDRSTESETVRGALQMMRENRRFTSLTLAVLVSSVGDPLSLTVSLILLFTEEVCDLFSIGFDIHGFWAAFIGALVISAVSFAFSRLLRRRPFRQQRWL